jgi:glycerol-3-phosphate cytidylyltransferase
MKIGITFSAFDFLHAGHVLMLEEAKEVCDYLIVGLHIDASNGRPDKDKTSQSVLERYIQLKACKFVDEIIPYETEEDVLIMLKSLPIDVRIIGEEYEKKDYTGKDLDIPVYYNRRQHDYSSSAIRKKRNEDIQ